MNGEKSEDWRGIMVEEICKVCSLEGEEEIEFVKDYIKRKYDKLFPHHSVNWEDEYFKNYLETMVEEYEKNVNDAIRKGFSRKASKIIGLLTVDKALEIAKDKMEVVMRNGTKFYYF